jgi:peptidoglycan DL-endopeptidase RipA
MSSSSTNVTLSTIGSDAGIPNLNVATVPENIRNGDSKAKAAYSEGLAFEDMLVNELTQQLANTMYGGSGSDSSDDSSSTDGTDSSSGSSMLGGASAYASMIPQALTSSIMDNGGLGMAESFAQELDPSLVSQTSAADGTTSAAAAGTSAATSTGATTASSTTDQTPATTTVGAAREVSI